MSARKAIRTYCKGCGEGTCNAVRDCDNLTCILHSYRHGKKAMFEGELYRPTKAIRDYCRECCLGMYREVANCLATDCALYPYRVKPKAQDSQVTA